MKKRDLYPLELSIMSPTVFARIPKSVITSEISISESLNLPWYSDQLKRRTQMQNDPVVYYNREI